MLLAHLFVAGALHADVSVAPIFGDHMVLQRELPVPVWGRAEPGEKITVEFAGRSAYTTADASGRWRVTLKQMKASTESRTLVVRGRNTLSFADVLVGEVWFCSGQSNMEKPLGPRAGQKPTDSYEEELPRADCPQLRLFQVPQYASPKPGDGTMTWTACSGDALLKTKFSAAAYYFGHDLQGELRVPVGLIHSSFGGTRIEAWMPPEAFASDPLLRDLATVRYPAWVKGVQATDLFESMVAPFVPFALRGFLWYQGEANVMNAEGDIYAAKMRALITSWREAWAAPTAPFYFAQLAPFSYSRQTAWEKQLTPQALPAVWAAQSKALEMAHTGIVATSDLAANGRDIHPTNKRDVGRRFARLALAATYGRALVAQPPRFRSARKIGPGTFEISFDDAKGLRFGGNPAPTLFELASPDHVFHVAEATVVNGRVEVRCPEVAEAVAVRFAWDELAMPNLVNAAGLPALPFRTDDWPLVLEVPKVSATK